MAWLSRAPETQPALGRARGRASLPAALSGALPVIESATRSAAGSDVVPDAEELRRAALQASWQRDRRVAKRRTAMRWAVWYGIRGLPLLLVAALVSIWLLPPLAARLQAPSHPPAQGTAPKTLPAGPQTGTPTTATVAPEVLPPSLPPSLPSSLQDRSADLSRAAGPGPSPPPESRSDESGIQLRLETPFQPPSRNASAAQTPPKAGDTAAPPLQSPSPQLKPDNWLHSKEP